MLSRLEAGWLKTALLYWDEVSTVVPDGVTVGRQHRETRAAAEANILTPLPVQPNDTVVQKADAALRNRLGKERIRVLQQAEPSPSNDPFSTTRPLDVTMTIEQGKLPFTSVTPIALTAIRPGSGCRPLQRRCTCQRWQCGRTEARAAAVHGRSGIGALGRIGALEH